MIKAFVFDAYGTLYDVQSVEAVTDAAFPGHGAYITQVWRLKQLEYSWLRSLMGRYEDFWTVTRESLAYTLGTLGLTPDERLFEDVAEAYNHLTPYPDAEAALGALSGYRRAILSNGSPDMLAALVSNSRLGRHLEATISVDGHRVFKPDARAYELVEERLGVRPDEVVFVSSNGFDVAGAKSFGFRVARIERVAPAALTRELAADGVIGPATLFKSLRMQTERLGYEPDITVGSLSELAVLAEHL
ncbi:haloacid dehalogenase type II [Methylobacterium sp. J-068]|uniref:haloacid dehalogenase type II n=1 Tax=Methylobacterium sp. J-068 TaxID=2836649 RepID=UPI001FB95BF1|nr:haloacid dehalogenase type II [Methylobacterium sp. J-068]MCJ2035330.1 haloacid dehalogenase type II [Methylobacterium sp. J-068]